MASNIEFSVTLNIIFYMTMEARLLPWGTGSLNSWYYYINKVLRVKCGQYTKKTCGRYHAMQSNVYAYELGNVVCD